LDFLETHSMDVEAKVCMVTDSKARYETNTYKLQTQYNRNNTISCIGYEMY